MRLILTISLLLLSFLSFAQDVPSISPQFFDAEDEITITYNVTGSNLANLSDAYIWMWLPDEGADAPSNINPASSNENATAPAKFTKRNENGNTYFDITLVLTDFLNQDASAIQKVGMLLKGNDWADGQTSDYITEIASGFSANLTSPSGNFGFYEAGQTIDINFAVSEPSEISFFVDDALISTEANATSFNTVHNVIDDGAAHTLNIEANNGAETLSKNYSYITTPIVEEVSAPGSAALGINYNSNTSATLLLEAPNKQNIFVIGDFNNWSLNNSYLMKKDGDRFWLTIEGLTAGEEYRFQYLVDGEIKIADPYATKIGSEFDDPQIIEENRYPGLQSYPSGQTTEAISYLQTAKPSFDWTDENYMKPEKEDLVIYELLIRDFTELRTIEAVRDRLDYLEELGINAIELMPVMEFEGNLSWGYNPFSMLAFDKFYGTEEHFKTFVNECHNRGIAIILDIALNHQFGRNVLARLYNEGLYGNPTSDNPWFNIAARHDFNVGYDMNHESEYTKRYVDKVVAFWLEEYHVDGYRYDLSKGFTQRNTLGNVGAWGQYDASRVALLKRLADQQWSVDADSYVILEHFADNAEETELANYGMMLWGNHNHDFSNLAKANNRNITNMFYESRGWENPHLINYMESHDEERVAFELGRNNDNSLKYQMQRLKLNAAFFFMVPGPKMLWQFGEFGYDEELNNDRLGIKPTRWEYLEDKDRQSLFQVYQSLIKLKTRTDYLNKENFGWSAGGTVKWIRYNDQETEFVLVGNFGNEKEELNQQIMSEGTWYDYFLGREVTIEASEDFSFPLAAGEFRLLVNQPIENFIDAENEEGIVLSNKVEENNFLKFKIFPNPSSGIVKLISEEQLQSVQVFDLTGKQKFVNMDQLGPLEYELNMTDLANGLYIIKAHTRSNVISKKILIQN